MAVSGMSLDQLAEFLDKKVDERLESRLKVPDPSSRSSPNSHHSHHQRHSPLRDSHSTGRGGGSYKQFPNYRGSSHSYSGPRTHHPSNFHHKGPRDFVRSVKIMITYVESACVFWGQVLDPEIVDATRTLENHLQSMCPMLPPVTHIGKSAVFATLYNDQWYRCITCHILDEHNCTEVLFVDYGNKERRHISELVLLKSPKFLDVPFSACPFRFPRLEPVDDKKSEAIFTFDTKSLLTGFVCSPPSPSEFTNIFLNRPTLDTHPTITTYNDLVIELGYAKKVRPEDEAQVPLPQGFYYNQSLQRRIWKLYEDLKDKEALIEKLSGDPSSVDQSPVVTPSPLEPCRDIRYPEAKTTENVDSGAHETGRINSEEKSMDIQQTCERINGTTPTVVESSGEPSQVVTNGLQDAASDVLSTGLPCELSQIKLEERDDCINLEDKFQEYLIELKDELQRFRCQSSKTITSDDHRDLLSLQEQIKSLSVNPELVELKASVDSCLRSLDDASAMISCCTDHSSLEKAVQLRNQSLEDVIRLAADYSEMVEKFDVRTKKESTRAMITRLRRTEYQSSASSESNTEELFDSLALLEESHRQGQEDLQNQYKEHVERFVEALVSCTKFFEENAPYRDTAPAPESEVTIDSLHELGDVLRSMKRVISQLNDTASQFNTQLQPLLVDIHSSLGSCAALEQLESLVECEESYKERAAVAQHALANKPDLTVLQQLRAKIKIAKRHVKLEQIKEEDDEEECSDPDAVKNSMLALHSLYREEDAELSKLLTLAKTTHPELFIEHPQLLSLNRGNGLLRVGWALYEFILPNTAACINKQGHNVYMGLYGEEQIYLVELPLLSVEGELEEQAVRLFTDSLSGCFAVMVDKRGLKALGATRELPDDY